MASHTYSAPSATLIPWVAPNRNFPLQSLNLLMGLDIDIQGPVIDFWLLIWYLEKELSVFTIYDECKRHTAENIMLVIGVMASLSLICVEHKGRIYGNQNNPAYPLDRLILRKLITAQTKLDPFVGLNDHMAFSKLSAVLDQNTDIHYRRREEERVLINMLAEWEQTL